MKIAPFGNYSLQDPSKHFKILRRSRSRLYSMKGSMVARDFDVIMTSFVESPGRNHFSSCYLANDVTGDSPGAPQFIQKAAFLERRVPFDFREKIFGIIILAKTKIL